ncbi:MAG: lysophospholipid acyltransferase family protein [Paludibacteraceae bacterium]|jgi:KDO2-lipid IV(A) lauroyltransferase|nr:lysophospholipid acyltransferase family protein [Paludibacteraceae bacterium]OPZ01695.1 MAG: Lipid A biosynthesis lauroyl acyltransferase [Bacteroidetes bacterium ADurb.BinA395]HPL76760.1 lysophospholipid acyltransferase family protein [Paludibacteraceae bacterium]
MFYVIYPLLWLLSLLPLKVLYAFSPLIYFLIYRVAGYRKTVVRQNLQNSFPELSASERRKIEKNFYRFFADLLLEIVKLLHISDKELLQRVKFVNVEEFFECCRQGKYPILMLGHYGNWEWILTISLLMPENCESFTVYKRLKNRKFDQFMKSLREKRGAVMVEKRNLARNMIRWAKEGKFGAYGFIADQSPSGKNLRNWTTFLHQPTAILPGAEQLARKFNYPVFYARVSRPKRGYYSCEILPIAREPRTTSDNEISTRFMQLLEEDILAHPELWLWSHRRWKIKPPVDEVKKDN